MNPRRLVFTLLVVAACGPESDPDLDPDRVGSRASGVVGWATPDEAARDDGQPVTCDAGFAVARMHCAGSHCERIRPVCYRTGRMPVTRTWTVDYISEESPNHLVLCGTGAYVTAIDCDGGGCDRIGVECTKYERTGSFDCFWTSPFSEEAGGYSDHRSGFFVNGVYCSGSRCDDKRLHLCRP